MKKYICVDLGTTTLGIAKSDIIGISHPYEEFRFIRGNYKVAKEHLIDVCELTQIFDVVIGYPLQIDRQVGERCESVDRFIKEINEVNGKINFIKYDESYSTIEAHERLKDSGYNNKKIAEVIDMYSAVVILEDFLRNYKEK